MEKKSIGRFIAALRKANGMTQKELAEQLNVSDKAVSRWERDESAPDLSLIPVIAEIFHVTSDEILRGERANYQENTTPKGSERGKKQIAMLLEKAKSKFQTYCLISVGVAGVGLLGAMICNFGFYRANIGFFVGCIFYLAAIILIGIAFLNILPTIKMEEVDENDILACRNHIVKWFYGTIVVVVGLFLFTLPLVTQVYDTYMGLNFDAWLVSGLPVAVVAIVIGIVLWWMISGKKFSVTESQKTLVKLKLKYVKRIAIALVITTVVHMLVVIVIEETHPFIEGTTFYKYEEFIEFMEKDVPYDEEDWIYDELFADVEIESTDSLEDESEERYYDDEGNEISLEEYEKLHFTQEVRDKDGNVVCTYIHRNESVSLVQFGHISYEEGEDMPITVYTHQDMRQEELIIDDLINPIFMMVYIVEIATGIVLYFKAKKIRL